MEAIVPRLKALKCLRTGTDICGGRTDKGEQEQPLSPMARLFHEPGSNVYIIAIMASKTKIYPDIVKDNLVHTLLKHPRFSSLQVVDKKNGGQMKWVQTKVDLDNHVIVPDLDPNTALPDKYVEDYISNLSKTTIDISKKPMWDLHLLNLRTSDAQATGILRVHHSMGDGMSMMSLLLACTRKVSDPKAVPTIPAMNIKPVLPSGFWQVLRLVWNTIVGITMFVMTALFLKDTETPLKGPPGVEHNPRRFIHRSVNFEDVKLVKNAMNITINDVVLGITQAGLSRYLNRRYGDGKSNEKKNNLPKNIRLRATFFFNIRPTAGISALVDMMEKGTKANWGNKIGYVLLPFTIAIRDDPLDYVREAKAVIDTKKASLEPFYTHLVAKLVQKFFGIKAAGVLNHRVFSNTTLWFSNVPGPIEEIAYYGHEIAYLAPSCYGQPNALMIHVVSYTNKLTFVISADEGTIPDPHQLCDDLQESLNLIKDAVLAREQSKDD